MIKDGRWAVAVTTWSRLLCRGFCNRGRGEPPDCDRFEKLSPTSG